MPAIIISAPGVDLVQRLRREAEQLRVGGRIRLRRPEVARVDLVPDLPVPERPRLDAGVGAARRCPRSCPRGRSGRRPRRGSRRRPSLPCCSWSGGTFSDLGEPRGSSVDVGDGLDACQRELADQVVVRPPLVGARVRLDPRPERGAGDSCRRCPPPSAQGRRRWSRPEERRRRRRARPRAVASSLSPQPSATVASTASVSRTARRIMRSLGDERVRDPRRRSSAATTAMPAGVPSAAPTAPRAVTVPSRSPTTPLGPARSARQLERARAGRVVRA